MILVGDFETASLCDLKIVGAARYAQDPTTDVLSFSYRVDGGEHKLWTPDTRDTYLYALAEYPECKFVSHSSFEQYIWMFLMVPRFGFVHIPIERWIDTQASCAMHALPLDLDGAMGLLGAPIAKDLVGRRVTLSLSGVDKREFLGRKHKVVNHNFGKRPLRTPEIMEKVYAYNRIDVDGTKFLLDTLGDVPYRERQVWELDQRINQRGINIDIKLVAAAKSLVTTASEPLIEEFRDLTGLKPTQAIALKAWFQKEGLDVPNVSDDTITAALEGDYGPLPGDTARVLYLRSLLSSSSLKKFDRMEACVCSDGRARGLLQYHGAATGRWSGRGVQPQNLPRPKVKIDEDTLIDAIMSRDLSTLQNWGEPFELLVSSLRRAFISDTLFGSGDYASMEARMVLALAGQRDKLQLFASGQDIYRDMAAGIYGLDKQAYVSIPAERLTVEQSHQRLIGKNTVLGCGYGMGAKKFHAVYCPNQSEEFAKDVIDAYRKVWAPEVPKLWRGLERASLNAMQNPNHVYEHRGIRYKLDHLGSVPTLVCKLFNGKKLYFPKAHLAKKAVPWDETDIRPIWRYWAGQPKGWVDVFGGYLTGVVCQALARELLVDTMFRFEEKGYPIVLTVHDEIIVEHPDITPEIIREIMTEREAWAEEIGMPVAVDTKIGRRLGK